MTTETTVAAAPDNSTTLAILDEIAELAAKAQIYADRDQGSALGAKISALVEQAKAAL